MNSLPSFVHSFENPLFLEQLFDRKAPLIVEIGVGKGLFIRDYARQHPEFNFLGIEKFKKWIRYTAERIEKLSLTNIQLMQGMAENFLGQIPDKSVHEYYILFPDPWPKRRHQNRRVIQTHIVQRIFETLDDEGELHIATDHQDYFIYISQVMEKFIGKQFEVIEKPLPFSSNYQNKYRKEGRSLFFLEFRKMSPR